MELIGLEDDKAIHGKLANFRSSIDKIENILENALHENLTQELNLKDRLNHDLFTAYMLNTLYWCYLRSKGLDPNTNKVKEELARVRQYMINSKESIERHTIRPSINKTVAERFVKHGIQKVDSGKRRFDNKHTGRSGGPPQSKRSKH